ncbi:MAG: hypothetical protein ACE5HF_03160 [Gemmatimonadota bacterium]
MNTNAMERSGPSGLRSRAPWVITAGLGGALIFAVAQKVAGYSPTIPEFMGSQIVARGGYSQGLSGLIGWGVHFGVALAYATLYALVANERLLPASRGARWGVGLGIAAAFAWVSTLLTAPAIGVTISLLSGNGFPGELAALNRTFGFVFWNHVAFFAVVFLVTVVISDLVRRPSGAPDVAPRAASEEV